MSSKGLTRFLSIDLSGAVSLLAVAGLIGVLGVAPITRLRQEQNARSVRLDRIQAEAEAVLGQIRRLRGELSEMTRQTEQHRHTLVDASDLNARIAEVIDRASANGLEVLAIEPGELSLGEMYGRTPIEIMLRGPLPDVVRYLHQMREESADLVVEQLEVRGDPDSGVVAVIVADWLTHAN